MSQTNQYKKWCFTLNNYSDEEYTRLLQCFGSSTVYFIIGKEVGESGTPHLQGYFELKKRDRITGLKNKISGRAHFEVARGTGSDNRVYCSKGGDFTEGGTLSESSSSNGKRKDRDELAREWIGAMASGRPGLDRFFDENPGEYLGRRHIIMRNYMSHHGAVERPDIRVRWIYGAPGVGKSRFAHEELPEAYIKEPRTKWWNGYMLEKTVIIDDFGPKGIDINHLLRWFDRYKCYVETKGDMCALYADNFIVTSNFHPDSVFCNENGDRHPQADALLRRLELIEM